MTNATHTMVAVGKSTASVASATTIAPIVAPTSGIRSKKPTTIPSDSAYGTPRMVNTIHVAIVARTLIAMLPSMYRPTAWLMSTTSLRYRASLLPVGWSPISTYRRPLSIRRNATESTVTNWPMAPNALTSRPEVARWPRAAGWVAHVRLLGSWSRCDTGRHSGGPSHCAGGPARSAARRARVAGPP